MVGKILNAVSGKEEMALFSLDITKPTRFLVKTVFIRIKGAFFIKSVETKF